MTAGERDWLDRHIALWSARASERRAEGGHRNENIASGIEWIVAGMRARLADATPSAALAGKIAMLEDRLAHWLPRRNEAGVMLRDSDIFVRARWLIACEIADLRGEPRPDEPDWEMLRPTKSTIVRTPLAVLQPSRPIEPFTMGLQMELAL